MAWIKIDDSFPDHPKVIGLSDKAFRIHIEGLCYSGRFLTDGLIPMGVAARFEPIDDHRPKLPVLRLQALPQRCRLHGKTSVSVFGADVLQTARDFSRCGGDHRIRIQDFLVIALWQVL